MTATKCPICGAKVASGEAYPFCSERCRLIDLGRWLDGNYRIPDEPASEPPRKSDDKEKDD